MSSDKCPHCGAGYSGKDELNRYEFFNCGSARRVGESGICIPSEACRCASAQLNAERQRADDAERRLAEVTEWKRSFIAILEDRVDGIASAHDVVHFIDGLQEEWDDAEKRLAALKAAIAAAPIMWAVIAGDNPVPLRVCESLIEANEEADDWDVDTDRTSVTRVRLLPDPEVSDE